MGFTEKEIGYYRGMVAKIFNNDPERKARIDVNAQLQLAAVRIALPGADDDTVVTFLVSVAVVVAKILATPLGEVAEVARGVFDNNIVAAATAMGAYDAGGPDMPQHKDSGREPATEAETAKLAKELDDILARAYL